MARTGPAPPNIGSWILLALAALLLSSVAYAGPGVWTSGGPYGGDVQVFAIDPTTPATLYAGTSYGGVFKSTDFGGTWAAASTGLPEFGVPALAIDPTTPSTLYAGTAEGGVFAGDDRVFPLFGHCGIPSTAHALSVNLAVTEPTAVGNIRLYPAGTPLPLASALNYSKQQTRASNAVLPLNSFGELAVRCTQSAGTAHVILDVNGYFQ